VSDQPTSIDIRVRHQLLNNNNTNNDNIHAWSARLSELERAVDRLSLLAAQESLVLLRASFSATRVQHLLRCSTSVEHETRLRVNSNQLYAQIRNCSLPDNKLIQSGLPICDGGTSEDTNNIISFSFHFIQYIRLVQ